MTLCSVLQWNYIYKVRLIQDSSLFGVRVRHVLLYYELIETSVLFFAGELYQTYSPVNMSRDDINNIKFVNASSLDTLTIIVMKQPSNCCTEVMLHDCISGLDYNLTTCKRRAFHLNITDTVLIPGDAYILNFKRNDTCIDRVIIVMKRKGKIVV